MKWPLNLNSTFLLFLLLLLLVAPSISEVGELTTEEEGTGIPPSWTKPDKMERTLYVQSMDSTVKLRCPSEGSPKPYISWYKDNVPIDKVNRLYGYPPLKTKSEKATLVINKLMSSDAGNYTCIVSNPYGTLQHSFLVEPTRRLNHVPILIEKSNNLTVMAGMPAHFYCKFKTDLAAIIHWARPTSNPFDSSFDKQSPNSYKSIQNTDEAVFESPRNVTSHPGSTVTFTCRAHIDLHKHILWVRLVADSILELSNATEVLTIDNITLSDAGMYACVVGTGSAHVEYVAYLSVVNDTLVSGPFSVTPIVASFLPSNKTSSPRCSLNFSHDDPPTLNHLIVERDSERGGIVGEAIEIIAPTIKIVKQQSPFVNSGNIGRSRLGSENTTLTMISEYELPFDPEWEVARSRIKLGRTLGEGAFGKVVQGEVKDLPRRPGITTVAIKMLKEGHTDSEMIDLVSEMTMMKIIGQHVNIINLLGLATRDGPLYVIVEYAEHGNLKDFLRKKSRAYTNEGYERPNSVVNNNNNEDIISEKQLISFARQVCKGMEYLGSMKWIHRDLAARNVLVAKDYTIKIADFGLARDVHADEYYKKRGEGILPVKWMAPEALFQRHYTTRSDVWSFGILLWEIMTFGARPYPSVPSIEKLFTLLKNGHRMEKPSACSPDVYSIMLECWESNPANRPSFTELIEQFDRILVFARESDYLDMSYKSTNKTCIPGGLVPRPPSIDASLDCSELKTFPHPTYQNIASSKNPTSFYSY
ncbi:Fibroblast growth factor receptor 1,Tyrosine kinase receptor Cad96Ca,Fibroblast growth factor receptor 4,Proto-oncogene tyrosine-protein kinase ROS,Fibroblast growth factor receptor,Angiopoietin-1 receptor,Fibroblast growth factor receptor 3,Vascular endothelial growth factor receptor 3,Tyrosine-protein kinase receptor torso,Proto-oncogene tyrosine-protein kinase receptor Ret,Tyrosine-protein kinase receptor Tie-1,Tyrosine-protein kinase receptor Tie-2,Vascular endothelial growth factor receptor 1,Fibrobla|uniref:receptor protein-tyrosine kinase n=1 Tax=Lepeophtheirus salmonis TaxID=72036 RepID=A0A7R8CYV1_LEPSM|nr:Fibroblast growth factor receptor 1,Tyrosine kinase receptor Cad96Ca,Fibroblast growth factor receptor 4,Proto-oncogene tyrosine-protein kinase ROS,Fibroblast growth factor receptor,Angiopoietin-1 receptor,Fibroblast growth factor receptor 3,Vascular endothelial growth factor receptor 3,Tyrosine-protein kinase receptor torso,Proto-oncogene tyrosine-protein kinase receptor Ret,Tyrosine-protein kinase receptor Tie-1,Tyrosine-protein kinase receptor Tie-2,Vascular endothelial growth factor receptor